MIAFHLIVKLFFAIVVIVIVISSTKERKKNQISQQILCNLIDFKLICFDHNFDENFDINKDVICEFTVTWFKTALEMYA